MTLRFSIKECLIIFFTCLCLGGCLSVSGLEDMKKELKYEDILENIDELNERLEDLETSDPYFYWKVMDTAAYITDKGSLFEVNKDKYNALITNYKKIIL